jgi:hypothetical protein
MSAQPFASEQVTSAYLSGAFWASDHQAVPRDSANPLGGDVHETSRGHSRVLILSVAGLSMPAHASGPQTSKVFSTQISPQEVTGFHFVINANYNDCLVIVGGSPAVTLLRVYPVCYTA